MAANGRRILSAAMLRKPERIRYNLLPLSDTHFLMPPTDPLEDPQTAGLYDFAGGSVRYLHIDCRVFPWSG